MRSRAFPGPLADCHPSSGASTANDCAVRGYAETVSVGRMKEPGIVEKPQPSGCSPGTCVLAPTSSTVADAPASH